MSNVAKPKDVPIEQDFEAESFDEYTAIVEALQPYIDSAMTGDGDYL